MYLSYEFDFLNPGILRFLEWSPDFNKKSQKSTNAHIRVCFYLN